MPNPRYDLLLLDFDGTLCATRPAIEHCLMAALTEETSHRPSTAAIGATVERGIGLDETFRLLVPDLLERDPALLPRLVTAYRTRYAEVADAYTTCFTGWKESLESLASWGVKTAVVSNKGQGAVVASLERFGLAQLVALVVGDTPGVAKKPDAAAFDRLVSPAFPEVSRSRILVVGDTDADILFARNITADSCWARYGYGRQEACAALSPQHTIDSPNEIERVVAPALDGVRL